MKSTVIQTLRDKVGLEWRDKRFLLAVSGGGDSMSLLHLLASEKCNIIVAHVNYNLRGKDSELDQRCVTQFCLQHHIPLETYLPDTKTYCAEQNVGIQEGARSLRYEWFDTLTQKFNLDYMVTAHHQEDVIETFFINLQRGSGTKGLQPLNVLNKNKLRPLVGISKSDIMDYLSSYNIKYRTDASNASNDYLRNSIRNTVLPNLFHQLPKLKTGIISSMEHLNLDSNYLFEQLEKEKNNVFLPNLKGGGLISNYTSQHKRLLYHIVSTFGFHFKQLEQLLLSATSGKTFYSSTHQLVINRDDLLIIEIDTKQSLEKIEIGKYGEYDFNGRKVSIKESNKPNWNSPNIAFFPVEKLTFPFTIRKWQDGDSFTPFGMKGKKKISDFLIDNKVSILEKENVLVVEHKNEIVWVVGHRTSELYKSGNKNKTWVAIEYLP